MKKSREVVYREKGLVGQWQSYNVFKKKPQARRVARKVGADSPGYDVVVRKIA